MVAGLAGCFKHGPLGGGVNSELQTLGLGMGVVCVGPVRSLLSEEALASGSAYVEPLSTEKATQRRK